MKSGLTNSVVVKAPFPNRGLRKAIATWICLADYRKFKVIAEERYSVTVSELLRSMVIDVLAEESAKALAVESLSSVNPTSCQIEHL